MVTYTNDGDTIQYLYSTPNGGNMEMNQKKVPFEEWACKTKVRTRIESVRTSALAMEEMIIRDRVSRMIKERARYIRSFMR